MVLPHILQLYFVSFPEGESLIMKIVEVIVIVGLLSVTNGTFFGTNSQVSRPRRSSSGFIYDASAHLSANYFNEVSNEVQVKTIFEFYLVQDRKGIEDSGGYLKGPYRKVIE